MKRAIIPVLLFTLLSCNFETKKISSEEVLEEEKSTLNWREVDEYPAFENCRDQKELAAARNCFENRITRTIYAYLSAQKPVVTESIHDTMFLYIEVSKKGEAKIDSVQIDTMVTRQLPDMEQWLRESLDSLPKIYPASKRGIPVSSVFKMPVVVKAGEDTLANPLQ